MKRSSKRKDAAPTSVGSASTQGAGAARSGPGRPAGETAYLLSAAANRASIERALNDVREGRTAQVRIDDL